MSIEIINGDLANPAHAQALVHLLSEYALDPMGGGKALSRTPYRIPSH